MTIKYITKDEAERVSGLKLDGRRRYFVWNGEVCVDSEFTIVCSGCSSEDPYLSDSKGSGCGECGYTGRKRTSVPMPVRYLKNTTKAAPVRRSPWLLRFVIFWFSGFRLARQYVGGKWELWWVDGGVNRTVWLHEPEYLKGLGRPAGCAIWDRDPKPMKVEFYAK